MIRKALCFSTAVFLFITAALHTRVLSQDYDHDAVERIVLSTDVLNLKAKSCILLDAGSGNVLLESQSREKLPIASLTKIMTMLLVMEAIDAGKARYEDMVPVSQHAMSMGGSTVWLGAGEEYSLKDMMLAVALNSANDASVALAEFIAGSEENFVSMMNKRAKELGLEDTHFLDCSGLTDDGHYSSARDIAVLTKELIAKHPEVIEFTTLWHSTFPNGTSLDNTNKLIRNYSGTIGLKTGFTKKAGHCLSAVAKRSNTTLIAVVMGCPDSNTRFAEGIKLLDYGFSNFESIQVSEKGREVKTIPVKKGLAKSVRAVTEDDVFVMVKKGSAETIEEKVELPEAVTAPVKLGQKLGQVLYLLEGKVVGSCNVIAENPVDKATFIRLLLRMFKGWIRMGKSENGK